MNAAHVHLILNHFPVAGMLFSIPLLVAAGWKKDLALTRASMIAVLVTGLITIPAFLTGEPSEEIIEHLPGISEKMIHTHEEAAEVAIWFVGAAAILSLVALVVIHKRKAVPKWAIPLVTALTIISAGFLGWTNNLGGKVRHPEIRETPVSGSTSETTKDRAGNRDQD